MDDKDREKKKENLKLIFLILLSLLPVPTVIAVDAYFLESHESFHSYIYK